jgi:DNA-binding XRE family transcriptional regulator
MYQWYTIYMKPEELKTWRLKHGFTQGGLGSVLGVTKTTVFRWEKGLRDIPPFLGLALESIKKGAGARKAGRPKSSATKKKGGNKT